MAATKSKVKQEGGDPCNFTVYYQKKCCYVGLLQGLRVTETDKRNTTSFLLRVFQLLAICIIS